MKRKGFTLVELLIVIVVIAILSAMMMMSSSEAVSSAKASTIVSNLNAMKSAALSYYADHMDTVASKDLTNENLLVYLKKTNEEKTEEADLSMFDYKIVITGDGDWYAQCDLAKVTGSANKNNIERTAILRKLTDRARSAGISFSNDADAKTRSLTDSKQKDYIYMWIR